MDAAEADMQLSRLFPGLAPAPPALDVSDIAAHSADVVPGGLFLACAGGRGHGLRFLGDALDRGASAVAWEPQPGAAAPELPAGVVGLRVPGLQRELGGIANRFFASPSASLEVVGITGTNGKTTVAWLLAQALDQLGRPAGYMGTLGHGRIDALRTAALTTPGCVTVHRQLRELADGGARQVAMEVSSHALDQGRVDGVAFRVAAFTNLSRDHLDYHGDLASYARAKARLFLDAGAAVAVINLGDAFGRDLAGRLPPATRLVGVAATPGTAASLTIEPVAASGPGQRLRLRVADADLQFDSPLLGGFNRDNLAVTAGILHAQGFAPAAIAAALASCQAPPGRMQLLPSAAGPRVVVDFAHTPDALRRVLEALRETAPARLWCVFGCGGDRDAGKRPLMGAVARELADCLVITDDNPRSEDPDAIVAAILDGAGRGPQVEVIRDRAAAIQHAVGSAAPDDVVLIAGKGHEALQIVGHEARAFSDQAVAGAALAGRP
jgi:UDP-N-acetylmuramoyl-L-alanyl-D-glutamate--2,6-diaminopimelate ligase